MSYPFAGNSSVQSSSGHHQHSQPYHPHHSEDRPDSPSHHYHSYSDSASLDLIHRRPSTRLAAAAAAAAEPDDHSSDRDDSLDGRYPPVPSAQPYPIALQTGPAYINSNMAAEKGDPYSGARGNSIWTRDDKRSFQQRSIPAKIFRVLFCILIVALIFILSIVCLIVMFVRPPNVAISGVGVASQAVTYTNGAFSFDVKVDISISNPNSILATIKKLAAQAYDANNKSATVGSGEIRDQKIVPHANTTVTFPFTISYDSSKDTDLSIIKDIASKCGLTLSGLTSPSSTGTGDLSFDLDIDVDVSVLSITIPVSFSQAVSFPCPLTGASVQSALGNNLGGVTGLSRRDEEEDRSPVEVVAAVADEFVKRTSILQTAARRSVADVHDTL